MKNFLNDPKFQEYAFEGKHKEYWAEYLLKNPETVHEFRSAEGVIHSIEFKQHEISPEKYQHYLNKYKDAVNIDSAYQKQVKNSHKKIHWDYFIKIAAVITIVVFSFTALLHYHLRHSISSESPVVSDNVIIRNVPRQMKSSVVLRDGTQVKLNSESRLEFPSEFSSDNRLVVLKGEAFFDVASDTTRPFLIQCENMTITVLGTSFNVRTYQDETVASVAVRSGTVMVSSLIDGKEGKQVIEKGEMLSMQKDELRMQISSFDPDEMFGWTEGRIVFTDADISEIVRRLERWYDVDIQVDLKKKIMKGYTGKFSNVALEHILKGIGFSLGFNYEINGKKVKIFD
jgi:transmembrane sensor